MKQQILFSFLFLIFTSNLKASDLEGEFYFLINKKEVQTKFLIEKLKNNRHQMVLIFDAIKKEKCTFDIRFISAPQKLRGIEGQIIPYLTNCTVESIQHKGKTKPSIRYYFDENLKLQGTINFVLKQKKFNFKKLFIPID